MSLEWIRETNNLIEKLEAKRGNLSSRIELMNEQLKSLVRRIEVAHELITDYMADHNISSAMPSDIKITEVATKSYPDMVIDVGRQTPGVLTVADTAEVIHEAVGGDLKQVRHSVGNALSRSPYFTKIARGQYRFTNHVQDKPKRLIRQAKRPKIAKSGVEQAIKELKELNPQWTKKEVLNYLIQTGFDFMGKRPSNSVNMVWGKRGYSKENKQQELPIGESIRMLERTTAVPLRSDN